MFYFVVLNLFSVGGWHSYAITELLCLIKILEELYTKMHGMISSLHLATTIIFDVLRRWSLYLNRCVVAFAPQSLDDSGCHVPFSLEPILAELEGDQ